MKIENQVCTLKQAYRLKTYGLTNSFLKYGVNSYNNKFVTLNDSPDNRDHIYPAFSVAELVVMNENCHGIEFSNRERKFYIMRDDKPIYFETFAQACAEKLIYAIEKEWIELTIVHNRLQCS